MIYDLVILYSEINENIFSMVYKVVYSIIYLLLSKKISKDILKKTFLNLDRLALF